MKLFSNLVYLALLVLSTVIASKNYNGYKVFRVGNPNNMEKLNTLFKLEQLFGLDFWNYPSMATETNIMVPPNDLHMVKTYLEENGFKYEIVMEDVQIKINENIEQSKSRKVLMNWNYYHRVNVIYHWLDTLQFKYPKLVKVSSIGKSSEGRDLKFIKISSGSGGTKRKPGIFIDAGIHAREWITSATATFLIKMLLNVTKNDRKIRTDIDWYFFPLVNPDGYEYTHTEDRMWRKTRSRWNGDECIGVDGNRNYDSHWGEIGVDFNPCAKNYPSPYPFSEPESKATAKMLNKFKENVKVYMTFHCFSQKWLTPYGYTKDLPDDYDELKELSERAVNALKKVNGRTYRVGSSGQILHVIGGNSRDYARLVAKVNHSYTVELPDTGEHGFLLPRKEIIPVGMETWEAVKVFARELLKKYPKMSYFHTTPAGLGRPDHVFPETSDILSGAVACHVRLKISQDSWKYEQARTHSNRRIMKFSVQ